MRFFLVTFLAVLLLAGVQASAQDKPKEPRILILLDGSSSMLHEWTNDNIRFQAAAQIVDKLMDSVYSVNKDVEFALRVYGHQHPTAQNNCFDSKLEVRFSKDNYTQMMLRLAALSPLGISPIAYSLEQAAMNDMERVSDKKYSLILITDGGESCEGDICSVVEELLRKKIDFKPYILSLVDYAPLRKQYDCMGDYLLVTKPEDIEPVVGKIVESYRKTFIQPVVVSKIIEAARKAPSVLQVKAPDVNIKVPVQQQEQPKTIVQAKVPEPEPEPQQQQPVIPEPEPAPQPERQPVKPSKIVVQDVMRPQRDKVRTFSLTPSRKNMLPQIYSSRALRVVAVPRAPINLPEPEARPKETVYKPMPTVNKTQQVVARNTPQPKAIDYTVSREEAKETTLTLYFTNGKKKYYESAPEIVLRDMKTNEPVYTFNRYVDVYGKPRPEKNVPPGTYNLTITGKNNYMLPNLEVRANENNIYEMVVPDGTLGFTYTNNAERPVREFSARVGMALKRGVVNRQLCSEVVEYEPGNYHVEISTNPIIVRNVDVDFGVTVYLGIEEPGGIEVYNNGGFQNIQFYYQHGDQYEQFKPVGATGDASKQEFLIQPGRYKVAYIKDPRVPDPKPIVKEFIIKSNTITEVILD